MVYRQLHAKYDISGFLNSQDLRVHTDTILTKLRTVRYKNKTEMIVDKRFLRYFFSCHP